MKTFWKTGVLVVTVALVSGCAKAPREAMDSASNLLTQAETQEADVYAPEQFKAAQDSFAAAQTEIDLQAGKFAMVRDYDRASELLAAASRLATEAAETGVTRKEEMRVETEDLLAQARAAGAEARDLLQKAPTGKEGRVALVAIGQDVDSLDALFVEVEQLLASDDILHAHERAQAALEKAQGLTGELQHAIEKTSRRG
jgi:outer membrane murein-binding lipoprotein Lpp